MADAIFISAALVFCFAWQGGVVSWLFKHLRLAFLGTLSYSLYLNHYWVINVMKALDLPNYGIKLEVFAWVFGLLIPISLATYYLIEKPGQRWARARWQGIKQWQQVQQGVAQQP